MSDERTYESAVAGSRRSSAGWTPATPGCARRSTSSSEGRELVEYCAAELEAVSKGLEELRLEELVSRGWRELRRSDEHL